MSDLRYVAPPPERCRCAKCEGERITIAWLRALMAVLATRVGATWMLDGDRGGVRAEFGIHAVEQWAKGLER